MKANMNYFKIEILAGHCAKQNDEEFLIFYFTAKNLIEACKKARSMPGVKHSRANAIKSVIKISEEEYLLGRTRSAYDRRNGTVET